MTAQMFLALISFGKKSLSTNCLEKARHGQSLVYKSNANSLNTVPQWLNPLERAKLYFDLVGGQNKTV